MDMKMAAVGSGDRKRMSSGQPVLPQRRSRLPPVCILCFSLPGGQSFPKAEAFHLHTSAPCPLSCGRSSAHLPIPQQGREELRPDSRDPAAYSSLSLTHYAVHKSFSSYLGAFLFSAPWSALWSVSPETRTQSHRFISQDPPKLKWDRSSAWSSLAATDLDSSASDCLQ